MKKIMGLVLGLSLVLGTTSLFAQDTTGTAGTDTGMAKPKHKTHKKKKSTDTTGAMSSDTTGGATK